jgi:hypothetical protein
MQCAGKETKPRTGEHEKTTKIISEKTVFKLDMGNTGNI